MTTGSESDTLSATDDIRERGDAHRQPHVFLVLEGHRPLAPPARIALVAVDEVVFGRGRERRIDPARERRIDVRIDDRRMSSSHARLTRVLRRWVLEDTGSKNGALVDGVLQARAELADGDVIELGQTFFLFREALPCDPGAPPILDASTLAPASPGLATLLPSQGRELPPLRFRREDLGLLVGTILGREPFERAAKVTLHTRAVWALFRYAWPGDVPELEKCLESALALAGEGPIKLEHLPGVVQNALGGAAAARQREEGPGEADRRTTASPEASRAPIVRFACDGDMWTVEHAGTTLRLKDSDGLRYLAYLVAMPRVEVHVGELLAQARSAEGRGGVAAAADPGLAVRGDLGDGGPLLDAKAKAAYARRVADLRAEIEEAESFNDPGRAGKARREFEALQRELARAVGLGGRDRKASNAAERARVNVTMRIRKAIARIAERSEALGHHLGTCVRTGVFCAYVPPPGAR